MDVITGITRGGTAWTPSFVTNLNAKTCIGCGRCYKVCTRDVLELIDRSEDDIDEDDEDDSESIASVMSLSNPMDCTGCGACSRVCPKSCFKHSPMAVGA
ncbi:MAG: ferredoxin III, nif-specific [Candidatus Dactylopiibacterium carminicum]|uniref:Ferredoxin III n=1 Tax=Candidatus Dactylopiibacterium carminicum TaxID=857335 RepID=A0A272ES74_9RHOO|nr:ferredoxin III, nif-specific [Candidatus Dactylopiibacterium carminicum]KAF7598982.1 ferredoxin III, nif-specific [Candidatus Dactylopiibacterium carminicum]PAS92951.1 MAG: ferredoxin III, nif-specific [Candidatus Dactylopiibacterium carminicum]PAS96601.1 MAG: ferredoxin III, nif-specific [Candidatus Dactylopiibacterium carminicum]PAS98994.1 MAG: ferredoxin III, nif-specific [Candidatus Dactylopiibacterium carminicum]